MAAAQRHGGRGGAAAVALAVLAACLLATHRGTAAHAAPGGRLKTGFRLLAAAGPGLRDMLDVMTVPAAGEAGALLLPGGRSGGGSDGHPVAPPATSGTSGDDNLYGYDDDDDDDDDGDIASDTTTSTGGTATGKSSSDDDAWLQARAAAPATSTPRSARSLADVMEGCLHAANFTAGHPAMREMGARQAGETRTAFFGRQMVLRHFELYGVAACLTLAGVLTPGFVAEAGSHMLFFAVAQVGGDGAPVSLDVIDALLAAGAPLNYTTGGVGGNNNYNLLHKAVDQHKIMLNTVATRVLRVTHRQSPAYFQRLYESAAAQLAANAPPATAARLRKAAERLRDPAVRVRLGGKRVELGRTVFMADIWTMADALDAFITARLLAAFPVDTFAHLVSQRDMYGRTPLHIAVAVTPSSLRLLRAALVAAIEAPTTPPAAAAAAATAPFLTDVFGYTPEALALALGHNAAAAELTAMGSQVAAAWRRRREGGSGSAVAAGGAADGNAAAMAELVKLAAPHNLALGRVASPLVPSFKSSYGVPHPATPPPPPPPTPAEWPAPLWVSPVAAAAVAAAAAEAGACDVDTLEVGDAPPREWIDRFVYDYVVPGRPVRLRGAAMSSPLRRQWRLEALLAAHGDTPFEMGAIPYAGSFGAARAPLSLAEYVLGVLYCAPDGELRVPGDVADILVGSAAASLLHDFDAADALCRRFVPDVDADPDAADTADRAWRLGAKTPSLPLAPSSASYIFEDVRVSTSHRGIAAGLTPDSLPFLKAARLPTWTPPRVNASDAAIAHGGAPLVARTPGDAVVPRAPGDGSRPLVDPVNGNPVPQFYVGTPGSGAPMHYHEDALNVLVYGEKYWLMEPPARSQYSTIAAADYVRHVLPHLPPAARPMQCTQAAGDVMYVPRTWGHAVLNTRTSIGFALETPLALKRY